MHIGIGNRRKRVRKSTFQYTSIPIYFRNIIIATKNKGRTRKFVDNMNNEFDKSFIN